jgi:hypothetical protein
MNAKERKAEQFDHWKGYLSQQFELQKQEVSKFAVEVSSASLMNPKTD